MAAISVVVWVVVWATTTGLSFGTVDDPEEWAVEPIVWIGLVVGVLLCTFASVYFTVALTFGAWERFQGRTPTFERCISAVNARLHVIVPWAILAGLVGAVFELLYRLPRLFRHMEQAGRNVPVVGQFAAIGSMIVAVVLESIWYFVTYLVVPILVVEQTGPNKEELCPDHEGREPQSGMSDNPHVAAIAALHSTIQPPPLRG